MDYSRHPEQSAALRIPPHFHSVEADQLGHCSGCMESSMGSCVGREDVFLLVLAGLERLAAAMVRGWGYWAAGLGIRVVGRGLFGRRLLSRYLVESTTSRRRDRENQWVRRRIKRTRREGEIRECGWINRGEFKIQTRDRRGHGPQKCPIWLSIRQSPRAMGTLCLISSMLLLH